jgi:hypothetical protein
MRKLKALLTSGSTASTTATNSTITLTGKTLRTVGVGVGDWLIIGTTRYLITKVKESATSSGIWNKVEVTPVPTATASDLAFRIYRSGMLSSPHDETFAITATGTNSITTTDSYLKALADSGDELTLNERTDGLRFTILDPKNLYVIPSVPAGTFTAKLHKRNKSAVFPEFGISFKFPEDPVEAFIKRSNAHAADANCTAASNVVSFGTLANPAASGIRAGDLLVLYSGTNSTQDVGHGPGVFVIAAVTGTNVQLTTNLTSTGSALWKIGRRV